MLFGVRSIAFMYALTGIGVLRVAVLWHSYLLLGAGITLASIGVLAFFGGAPTWQARPTKRPERRSQPTTR